MIKNGWISSNLVDFFVGILIFLDLAGKLIKLKQIKSWNMWSFRFGLSPFSPYLSKLFWSTMSQWLFFVFPDFICGHTLLLLETLPYIFFYLFIVYYYFFAECFEWITFADVWRKVLCKHHMRLNIRSVCLCWWRQHKSG